MGFIYAIKSTYSRKCVEILFPNILADTTVCRTQHEHRTVAAMFVANTALYPAATQEQTVHTTLRVT